MKKPEVPDNGTAFVFQMTTFSKHFQLGMKRLDGFSQSSSHLHYEMKFKTLNIFYNVVPVFGGN